VLISGVTINRIGPHRATPDPQRTASGPYRAGNYWLFRFDDELKGVRRAKYPQLTTEVNPIVDARDALLMDVFNVFCLFSWSPSTRGSQSRLNSTRNSPRSEIISHFWPGTDPARSGAVNSHTLNVSKRAFKEVGMSFRAVYWLPCWLKGYVKLLIWSEHSRGGGLFPFSFYPREIFNDLSCSIARRVYQGDIKQKFTFTFDFLCQMSIILYSDQSWDFVWHFGLFLLYSLALMFTQWHIKPPMIRDYHFHYRSIGERLRLVEHN